MNLTLTNEKLGRSDLQIFPAIVPNLGSTRVINVEVVVFHLRSIKQFLILFSTYYYTLFSVAV